MTFGRISGVLQNLDEPQEEESDKVLFEHFLGCYTAFHHGRDDYREELDALKENFMRIYEVDDEVGAELVSPKLQMSQFNLVLCNLIFGLGDRYRLQSPYPSKLGYSMHPYSTIHYNFSRPSLHRI